MAKSLFMKNPSNSQQQVVRFPLDQFPWDDVKKRCKQVCTLDLSKETLKESNKLKEGQLLSTWRASSKVVAEFMTKHYVVLPDSECKPPTLIADLAFR